MTAKIQGYATAEGTGRFKERFEGKGNIAPGHFRTAIQGLSLSSLGLGSYLGNMDVATDEEMIQAAVTSITSGAINVLDTAINYRYQLSERSFASAITQVIEHSGIQRDQLFLCSKNGYITPDAHVQKDFRTYFEEEFIRPGIVTPDDIVGGIHCMSPGYLNHQLNRSLDNMGLETLDLMYLHNAAESQLGAVGLEEFLRRLRAAFEFYERARSENHIRYYGLATWSCFRTNPQDTAEYLSLESVVRIAEEVGGKETHGFRFVQFPYNFAMSEALTLDNQMVKGKMMTLLEACTSFGIQVFTSVPLLQGQLLRHPSLPRFEGLQTNAQYCLQFARSTPGVMAPLVGQKNSAHVEENLKVASVPPLTLEQFERMFAPQQA